MSGTSIIWIGGIAAGLSLAFRLGSLTFPATVWAFVLALLLLAAGGIELVVIALVFLTTASLFTRWPGRSKDKGEPRRSRQVMANGLVAAVLSVVAVVDAGNPLYIVMIIGSYAAATADTWATEWGSGLGGAPFSLRDFRKTEPGTSGAITPVGTLASFAGAALIGGLAVWIGLIGRQSFPVILVAGVAGSILDSVAGAWYQAHWLDEKGHLTESKPGSGQLVRGFRGIDNDAVNVIATLTGALVAGTLFSYVPNG